jgi:hypothetical protein
MLTAFQGTLDTISERNAETVGWAKEFHRSMMEKYAQGIHTKIYAFVYSKPAEGKRKLMQIPALKFEDADILIKKLIIEDEKSLDGWILEGYASTIVPLTKNDTVFSEVDNKLTFDKPIDVYINNLLLAKERFASTPSQKKAMDAVIDNAKKSY